MQVAYHLLYAECQYSLGNWEVARTYYSSALQLTGGANPRALYGITACTASLSGQRVRCCILDCSRLWRQMLSACDGMPVSLARAHESMLCVAG